MKVVLATVIAFVIATVLVYAVGSLTMWSLDPRTWAPEGRGIGAALVLLVSFIVMCATISAEDKS